MTVKVILFDLGGVVVRLGDAIFPPEWLPNNNPFSLNEWLRADAAKAFEVGAITHIEFAKSLKRELSIAKSEDQIIEKFAAWPEALFPSAHDLLTSLRRKYTLAALSNINELHAPRMLDEFELDKYFDQLLFSHELGVAKPDPQIFHKAVELLNVEPHEIVFFDDVETNVQVAMAQGLNAHQVFGLESILDHLSAY